MIQILSEKIQKGKQFESLLKNVLSKQGYGDIESNIHTTGTEIDIAAKDNVSGNKIYLEAKAHRKPIDTPTLKKFITTANNDVERGVIDHAIFWSLSGINSTARHYFDNELVLNSKKHISIKNDVDFQKILVEIGIIGSESSIERSIVGLTKKNLSNRELIYHQNQWYFIQYCAQDADLTHFFIVDNFGKPVDDVISKEIRALDDQLKQLEIILLDTKNKILEFLIREDSSTINEMIDGLKETKVDIQSTIDELKDQQLIVEENANPSKYSLSKEISAFLIICKEFLKNNKMLLMNSNYFTKTMNTQIVEYIKNRWNLKLAQKHNELVLKICLVSPSALEYSLFDPTTSIQNLREQYNDQIPRSALKLIRDEYFRQVVLSILTDIHYKHTLGLQKTRGVLINIDLRMATEDKLFFRIHTKVPLLTMNLKGSVKQGQMLSATGPEAFLEASMILHNLGDTRKAIKEIDDALKAFPNEGEWLRAAYINKGMYLTEIGKLDEAEKLLLEATKLFPKQKEGWLNLGNLYLSKNQLQDAKIHFKKALKLDNNYSHAKYGLARVAIRSGDENACLKLLKDVLLLENQFVTRVQLDNEFKNLRKTKHYFKLLTKLN